MKIKEDYDHGSEDGRAHSKWGKKGSVPPKRLRGLGSSDGSERCDVSNCGIGNNGLWQRLGGEGMGSHQWAERHQFWQVNPLFITGETYVTGDPLEAERGIVGEGGREGPSIPEGLGQEIRGG